jgi:hypothetical protein
MPPPATSPLCAYMQGLLGQQQNKEIAIVVLDSAKAPCSTLLSLLSDRPNPLMTGGHSSMPTLGKNNKKQARKVRFEPSSRGTYTPLDAVKRSSSDPTIVGASRWEHKQCCASRTSPTGLKAANAKWDTFIEKPRRRLSFERESRPDVGKTPHLVGNPFSSFSQSNPLIQQFPDYKSTLALVQQNFARLADVNKNTATATTPVLPSVSSVLPTLPSRRSSMDESCLHLVQGYC